MTREFPDELLSALIDGELSESERAQVEGHVAANAADRQLLDDLKALRGDLASLPRPAVSPDFAERVVRAALAEAEKQNEARGMVSHAPPGERHFWRRWKFTAAAASAAALAACILLVVQIWLHSAAPQPIGPVAVSPLGNFEQAVPVIAALPEQLRDVVLATAPGSRDAVVVRLKAPKDRPLREALDAALVNVGIGTLAGNAASPAALIEQAYRRSLEAANGDGGAAAAEVLFVEAPLEKLQGALSTLASNVADPLRLEAAGKLALRRADDEGAEGEGSATAPQSFSLRLKADQFRLPAAPSAVAAEAGSTRAVQNGPVAALRPEQHVRVLLLVVPE